MKTRFGWAVGLNVAAACLVMQGCKAPRVTDNNYGNDVKAIEAQPSAAAPAEDVKVAESPAPASEQAAPAPAVAPAPAPVEVSPAPVAEPEYTLYAVKPGDMLSKISRRYNIRQRAILDLNPGLSPDKLYVGRKIKLPGRIAVDDAAPAAAPASAAAASVKPPKTAKAAKYTGATRTYVAKSGDSLGKIAQENGTTIRTLKELNGLKSDRVFIGQKFKVPAGKDAAKAAPKQAPAKKAAGKDAAKAPADAVKKDSSDAAAQPAAPAQPAAEAQPAQPAAPAVQPADGTSAQPVAAQPAAEAQAAAPASAQAPAATLETHTVKEGEDIVSIAISYGVSPSALMDANDLKSSEVKPGDVLKVPAKNAQ